MKDKGAFLKHNNNFNLIRTLAALQVITVHAFHHFEIESIFLRIIQVFPGVPVFFFLSGYLISKSYRNKQHLGLKAFFRNRALRIFPALWVCIILSVISVAATGYLSTVDFSWTQMIAWLGAQLSFFQFYNVGFMREYGVGVLNGSLWTIAVELQFYVLTPVLFWLFRKAKWLVFLVLLASLAMNMYIKVFYDWENVFFKLLYASSLPWFYMFILGFLFVQFEALKAFAKRVHVLIWLLLYVLAMNFVGAYEVNGSNAINPVAVLFLTFFLISFSAAKLRLPALFQRFLDNEDISYGIYIYHMPVINFLLYVGLFGPTINSILVLIITFAAAYLSWTFVEKRCLKLKI